MRPISGLIFPTKIGLCFFLYQFENTWVSEGRTLMEEEETECKFCTFQMTITPKNKLSRVMVLVFCTLSHVG